jgi:hypothetical protein
VVREGWGQGGEMTQALFAHMNNKKINKIKYNKNNATETTQYRIERTGVFISLGYAPISGIVGHI